MGFLSHRADQRPSDRLERPAFAAPGDDSAGDFPREGRRCAQSLSSGALGRQGIPRALADQTPLIYGQATGPVAITIGGCTPRTYRPDPAEQALIATYQTCPH